MDILNAIESKITDVFKGIVAKIGNYNGSLKSSEIISEDCEIWQQYGLVSRFPDADEDGCTDLLTVRQGDEQFAIAQRDLRCSKVIGSLKAGDSALYSLVDKNAFCGVLLKSEDGSITIYTPGEIDIDGNAKSAQTIALNPDKGTVLVSNVDGSSISITKSGGISLTSANGMNCLNVSNDGIQLMGTVTVPGNLSIGGQTLVNSGLTVSGPTTTGPLTAAHITGATTLSVAGGVAVVSGATGTATFAGQIATLV